MKQWLTYLAGGFCVALWVLFLSLPMDFLTTYIGGRLSFLIVLTIYTAMATLVIRWLDRVEVFGGPLDGTYSTMSGRAFLHYDGESWSIYNKEGHRWKFKGFCDYEEQQAVIRTGFAHLIKEEN